MTDRSVSKALLFSYHSGADATWYRRNVARTQRGIGATKQEACQPSLAHMLLLATSVPSWAGMLLAISNFRANVAPRWPTGMMTC